MICHGQKLHFCSMRPLLPFDTISPHHVTPVRLSSHLCTIIFAFDLGSRHSLTVLMTWTPLYFVCFCYTIVLYSIFFSTLGLRSCVARVTGLPGAACCPPRCQNEINDVLNASILLDAREYSRAVAAHELRVAVHDLEGRAHVRCEIRLRGTKGGWRSAPLRWTKQKT